MSVYVSSAVWKHSKAKGGALLVLLAIADVASHDGAGYIAVSSLARQTRLTVRQVYNVLLSLESMEEIEAYTRGGKDNMNLYWVKVGDFGKEVPARVAKARDRGKQIRNGAAPGECEAEGDDLPDGEIISVSGGTAGGEIISPSPDLADGEICDTDGEAHFSKILKPTSPNTSIHHYPSSAPPGGPDEGPLRAALKTMSAEIGEPAFNAWFRDVKASQGLPMQLTAPTMFIRNWIASNYLDRLNSLAAKHGAKERIILVAAKSR
jgi:hypothetical protein